MQQPVSLPGYMCYRELISIALCIIILTTRWRPPLMTIYSLTPRCQPRFHIPNLWRTVVLHLCLCMEDWCMSVQAWVLVHSTKMYLHTRTTGTVLSVAGPSNKPQHATVPVFCAKFLVDLLISIFLLFDKNIFSFCKWAFVLPNFVINFAANKYKVNLRELVWPAVHQSKNLCTKGCL